MTAPLRNRRHLAWTVGLTLTAALVSVVLSYPKEVAHPVLGDEWKCSHTAFLTSCTRIAPSPARQSFRASPILFRQV
jgi:hypothetical protein